MCRFQIPWSAAPPQHQRPEQQNSATCSHCRAQRRRMFTLNGVSSLCLLCTVVSFLFLAYPSVKGEVRMTLGAPLVLTVKAKEAPAGLGCRGGLACPAQLKWTVHLWALWTLLPAITAELGVLLLCSGYNSLPTPTLYPRFCFLQFRFPVVNWSLKIWNGKFRK